MTTQPNTVKPVMNRIFKIPSKFTNQAIFPLNNKIFNVENIDYTFDICLSLFSHEFDVQDGVHNFPK